MTNAIMIHVHKDMLPVYHEKLLEDIIKKLDNLMIYGVFDYRLETDSEHLSSLSSIRPTTIAIFKYLIL